MTSLQNIRRGYIPKYVKGGFPESHVLWADWVKEELQTFGPLVVAVLIYNTKSRHEACNQTSEYYVWIKVHTAQMPAALQTPCSLPSMAALQAEEHKCAPAASAAESTAYARAVEAAHLHKQLVICARTHASMLLGRAKLEINVIITFKLEKTPGTPGPTLVFSGRVSLSSPRLALSSVTAVDCRYCAA